VKLLSCVRCEGFVPPLATTCPHCSARVEGLLPMVGRAALAVVGGSAMSMTLMACYGLPPCEALDNPVDADNDGFAVADSCGTVDCDDTNADIHPGADDALGDAVDQNCDGEDGVVTFCTVDTDCPEAQPTCNLETSRCEVAAAEGEGEGEGENP
jgi:hypothetical protein